jgi:hypothetical protein
MRHAPRAFATSIVSIAGGKIILIQLNLADARHLALRA